MHAGLHNRISSQPKVIWYLQFNTCNWTGDQQSTVVRVSDFYLSPMAVASSTNPSLGLQGLSPTRLVHGHDRSNFPPIQHDTSTKSTLASTIALACLIDNNTLYTGCHVIIITSVLEHSAPLFR